MRILRTAVLGLAIGLCAGQGLARTEVDADEKVDFSSFSTFVVEVGTPPSSERASREITKAVEENLAAKGLAAVDSGSDLIVRTHVLVDAHSLEELSDETQWEFWTGVRSISAYDLGEGTLVIDFVDRTNDRVVWRGLTTEKLGGTAKSNYARIPKIVRRLLKRFPPK